MYVVHDKELKIKSLIEANKFVDNNRTNEITF